MGGKLCFVLFFPLKITVVIGRLVQSNGRMTSGKVPLKWNNEACS